MFKRLITGVLVAAATPSVMAASIYLSPAFSYMSNKTDTVTFQGYTPKFIIGVDNDRVDWNGPNLYLAAEIFAAPFRAFTINDIDSSGGNNSLKPVWTYGVNLLPGVNMDAVLKIYGRLGYVKTKFTEPNSTYSGYQVGLGGEYRITKNWAARLDYIRTNYSSVGDIGSPAMDEGMLSILYRLI